MLKTACHQWHVERGARMVDFAGWEMPVQYSTITEEHHAVRRAAGLFDIGHMGRLCFTGPDACGFLDDVVTNNVHRLDVGQIRYALVCNDQGGILDDVLVYRFDDFYMMVVNAANRLKILDWLDEHAGGFDVHIEDRTFTHGMVALQGPQAFEILHPLANFELGDLSYYWGVQGEVLNTPGVVSRTGYTGEDGFEVIVPSDHGLHLWETIIDHGRDRGLLPAGLGARDTLRLEAAMPLYGHELDESMDPITAGLSFAVKLKGSEFIGRAALQAKKAEGARERRVGLELEGRRIAREGSLLYAGDEQVGRVTSGTFSPTLETPIAMGYAAPAHADVGTRLDVDIRGRRHPAAVVELPFYKRT